MANFSQAADFAGVGRCENRFRFSLVLVSRSEKMRGYEARPDGYGMKKLLSGPFSRQLAALALIFAGLFTLIAIAQGLWLRWHFKTTTRAQLSAWADLVSAEIHIGKQWDIQEYRQSSINAPMYYVLTKSGLVIDIEGFIPGVIGRVTAPDVPANTPATITTETGETWRILATRVKGGVIYTGVPHPEAFKEVDAILLDTTRVFGASIGSALGTRSNTINRIVHYAIVDDGSTLRFSLGGIPLRVDPATVQALAVSHSMTSAAGDPYYLYSQPLTDAAGREAGTIIVPQDEKVERGFVADAFRFNAAVGVVSWLVALALIAIYAIPGRRHRAEQQVPLAQAIREGEGPKREFKETLEFDPGTGKPLAALVLASLKTIAAFLNTDGGTLYIGVADDGGIKGIERDYALCNQRNQNKDGFALKLQSLVSDRIEPKPLGRVKIEFVEEGGPVVCQVTVQRSPVVVHVDKKQVFVRDGNATRMIEGAVLTNWILQRAG